MIKQNTLVANQEAIGLTERQIQRDFENIKLGMCKDDVVRIVGVPDETRQVPFGGEMLTVWVYRIEARTVRIWFDESGKLRLKN